MANTPQLFLVSYQLPVGSISSVKAPWQMLSLTGSFMPSTTSILKVKHFEKNGKIGRRYLLFGIEP
jgi:hypothetical protein